LGFPFEDSVIELRRTCHQARRVPLIVLAWATKYIPGRLSPYGLDDPAMTFDAYAVFAHRGGSDEVNHRAFLPCPWLTYRVFSTKLVEKRRSNIVLLQYIHRSFHSRRQRRSEFTATQMPTNVPCGKSLRSQPVASSRHLDLVLHLRQASLVKTRKQGPRRQLRHSTHAAVHPIGWIHGLLPASRAKTPHAPHRPEGFRFRSDVATSGDNGSRPPNAARFDLASQALGRSRAPRANIHRRCFPKNRALSFANHPFCRAAPSDRSLRATTAS